MPDEVYEVELTALVYGGDALGRLPDGRAVFVPFGLPGERVRVALTVEKRGLVMKEMVRRETLIHLEEVTKTYRMGEVLVEALRGVSIDIYQGELLVILGASGCGKSTMLNIVGGMDKVSSGRIVVNNRDLSQANEKELTNYRKDEIGFVFQFYNLVPDLTGGENIALAAELAHNPLSVDEVLQEVGLLHKKDHFPSQMSGGEQQRISIARAIVKRPRILLCDEPTGALDYQTGKSILVLLEKIAHNSGNSVIIVTHNAAFGAMADRVLKMRSGRLIETINNPFPVPAEKIEW
jgi:putative ABC transport system ATP-binding protein